MVKKHGIWISPALMDFDGTLGPSEEELEKMRSEMSPEAKAIVDQLNKMISNDKDR